MKSPTYYLQFILFCTLTNFSFLTNAQTRVGDYTGTSGGLGSSYFGRYAGHVSTGSSNTFLGAYSGRDNTSGNNNTFIGNDAGEDNTTGYSNTLIGAQSGQNFESGFGNSTFGYQSGRSIRGNLNVLLGYRSGSGIDQGDNNTYIGAYAGYYSGSYNYPREGNVFVGYRAGYGTITSNKLYIANSSTSSPLIWGDFETNALIFNGTAQVTGAFNPSGGFIPGAYLDDDGSLGGSSDDWMRFNGYLEMRSNTDSYGIVLRDKDDSNFFGITQKDGKSYLADSKTSTDYFLRGDGANADVRGTLSTGGVTTRGDIYGKYENSSYSNLYRFGGVYFTWDSDNYGTNTHHSIRSTYGNTYGDDITINTFHNLRVNLDANSNNGDAVFEVGTNTTGTTNTLFRLKENGNLGIGDIDPAYKVHVAGDIYADGGWFRVSGQRGMYSQTYGTYIYAISENYWKTRSKRGIVIANKDDEIKGYLYHDNGNAFGLLDGDGHWGVRLDRDTDTRFYINNSEKMRIQSDGYVGIGTTEPASMLDVNGTITTTGDVSVGSSSIKSGQGYLRFMYGNRADDETYEWQGFYSGTTRQGIILYDGKWSGANNVSDEFSITAENDNKLTLNTNGNDIALMPDGSGKVGVGTLSPQEKLHVNGAIRGHVSDGALRIQSAHGYVDVGSKNTSWSHFSTDRPKYYFNKGVVVDEGIVASYDEDLAFFSDYRDDKNADITISAADGDATIHNNLEIEGSLTLNKSTISPDNTPDDLLVMRGDGTLATRSVNSIESPWLYTEILVGTDRMKAICPDSDVIGDITIDVIDLNGNLRFGDNAYIDDDLDYGDNGDNDDIPDDWMKFSDRIEFKSSHDDYGLVLFDKTSYTDFLNLHHEGGSSYLSNGTQAANFFIKSTGRDVEFGGNVTIPMLETSEYTSGESLTITVDNDNNSNDTTPTESISFGANGNIGGANYREIMRLQENGDVFISQMENDNSMGSLLVRDATTGKLYSREASSVGPWDIQTSGDIHYGAGKMGLGISGDATETIDVGTGTIRVRNLSSTTVEENLLVVDASGNFLTRNTSSLNLSPWTVNASNLSYLDNIILGANEIPSEKLDVRGNAIVSGSVSAHALSSNSLKVDELIEDSNQADLLVSDASGNIHTRGVSSLIGSSNTTAEKILVTDDTNNFFYRDASSFNLSPWDNPSSSLITFDNGGVRISRENDPGWSTPQATLDVVGDLIIRDVPRDSEQSLHDVLVLGTDGLVKTRNIFTFDQLTPWTRTTTNGIFLETGRIGIGEENTFTDIKAQITSNLKVGLNVTTNYSSDGYGIISTVNNTGMKAFAAIDENTGEDVFRVYGTGKVEAKEVLVDPDIWHDDVFRNRDELKSLEEVESFIDENEHLPDIPSEKEVLENGVNVGEMEGLLLKKIEELTLYIIEQNKELKEQNERIEALESKLEKEEK